MKTKAQIVQDLLEKKLISAEDAVILLMRDIDQPQVIFIPPFQPVNPYPTYPTWPWSPFTVMSSGASAGSNNLTAPTGGRQEV